MADPFTERKDADVLALFRQRIVSKDWWVIPWVSHATVVLSLAVEERFYRGEHDDDFDLYILNLPRPEGGFGLFPVTFAHKEWMSAPELAGVVAKVGGLNRTEVEELVVMADTGKDFVYLVTTDELATAGVTDARDLPNIMAFKDWLYGPDEWTPR